MRGVTPWLVLGCLVGTLLVTWAVLPLSSATSPIAMAQEEEFEEGGGDAQNQGQGQAAGEQGQQPAGGEQTGEEKKKQSQLQWVLGALGWFFSLVFLALSFTLVALIVMNLLTTRRDNIVPLDLVQAFEEFLNAKKYKEAYELAREDESLLGQVLSAGLSKLQAGYNKAIEAMQEVGEQENMKLEHRLSYMALIGTISPMVGLFGTVWGMIDSFNVIAIAGHQPKPAELAEGISTALLTTLIGLAIAIPAIAAYNILRNRLARLVLEAGIISENLMSRFEPMAGARKA